MTVKSVSKAKEEVSGMTEEEWISQCRVSSVDASGGFRARSFPVV